MRSSVIAIAVALAAFAVVSFAEAPPRPVFPRYFSSSIKTYSGGKPPLDSRWFYDQRLNKERVDTVVTFRNDFRYSLEIIRDYSKELEYQITQDSTGDITCVYWNITYGILKPDFSKFKYDGIAVVGLVEAHKWEYAFANATFHELLDYYTKIDSNEPVRFTILNSKGLKDSTTFHEFDEAPQDPSLFEISPLLLPACMYKHSNSDMSVSYPVPQYSMKDVLLMRQGAERVHTLEKLPKQK